MASFLSELWESIFTPGPTPVLLRASNATFAALQLLLLVLLLTTHSVHFVALSILCAGLWWSINWFAAELAAAQKRDKDKDEAAQPPPAAAGAATAARTTAGAADDSSDTEVESRKRVARGGDAARARHAGALEASGTAGGASQLRQRSQGSPAAGTQSSASTEDEWERVSESEGGKVP